MQQDTWRLCKKCRTLFYCGNSRGVCAADGGPHDPTMASQYTLDLGPREPSPVIESGWRWCRKCQGLLRFHSRGLPAGSGVDTRGICPAGGHHDPTLSGQYSIQMARAGLATGASVSAGREAGWLWCQNCAGLFNLNPLAEPASPVGACAGSGGPHGGGPHDGSRSPPYDLLLNDLGEVVAKSEAAARHNDNVKWRNWGETLHTDQLFAVFRPRSLDQVLSIVQDAASLAALDASGTRVGVRVAGSSWSFSGTVKPDERHYLIETRELNAEITSVTSRLPADSPYRGLLYHVEAGIKIRELYLRLAARGLALPTQGGSGGQSVAGVMATGTHGGDIELPPIPDAVRAIHLVAPDGRHYWIERESTPVTTRELIEDALPFLDPDNIVYRDDWFDAVLVSFGAMGVIYSVVIEARPAFQLEETTVKMPWEQVRSGLRDGSIFMRRQPDGGDFVSDSGEPERIRFLEVVMAPNSTTDGRRECIVTTRQEVQPANNIVTPPAAPAPGTLGTLCTWPLLPTIAVIQGTLPLVVAAAVSATIGASATAGAVGSIVPGVGGVGAAIGLSAIAAVPIITGIISAEMANLATHCDTLMGCASALANTLNRYGALSVLRDANGALLSQGRQEGSRQNVSYWIMDGFDYSNPDCLLVDSLEAFFPADDGASLVADLDALMDAIDNTGTVLGYLSLRFTGPSTALLAMQQPPASPNERGMTCSAELTIVKELPDNGAVMDAVQRATLDARGRLHWGQKNEVLLEPTYLMVLRGCSTGRARGI